MTSADFKKAAAPHPDGFGGARDAVILENYAGWKAGNKAPATVNVQCVGKTKDLLKRAGFLRTKSGEFYPVKVQHDEKFNRLQLA